MNTPYKLITKEVAADFLTVSKRTIDNWIADGTLPMPTTVGRRVYWHPDVFRSWQDKIFGVVTASVKESSTPIRRGRPRTQMK